MKMNRLTSIRFTTGFLGCLLTLVAGLSACTTTDHAERPASLGRPVALAAMEKLLDQPGPVEVETVNSADWSVPLSGLLDLDSPAAKAAGLHERDEPIQVYLHVLRHPSEGLYLVDTGFAAQTARDPGSVGASWIVRHEMRLDHLQHHKGPADVQREAKVPLKGVFLTHAHLDHIAGLPEVPLATPIYVGPGETSERHWSHMFIKGMTDQLLAGRPELQTWNFADTVAPANPDADGPLAVLDVFGDGSVFAIHTPGHTRGSTAYLVRTPGGPVLLTGDTCHTRWGWEHGVEPGSYTRDPAGNLVSLRQLKALVARHPQIQIRLGHQA
jgi:glyoxylase-like metal-dependent hydrolase (beta-lactamase superfamily II)